MNARVAAFVLAVCVCGRLSFAKDAPAVPSLEDLRARVQMLEVKLFESGGAISALVAPRQYRSVIVSPGHKGESSELTRLFQKLYLSASGTGEMLEFACTDDALTSLCGRKFSPGWLSDPASLEPTTAALGGWVHETEAALDPFWREVCKLARTKTQNEALCPDPATVKLPWYEPSGPKQKRR